MHVVVMGCGRVGTALTAGLQKAGHSVAVVDQEAASFARLGSWFTGTTVTGVGFDRDTLREAGIERAEAFAAVSSGDNSNIIAARVAREQFGIERVVARIYDPRRADVYERLGIPTVRTVRWTADQALRLLDPPAMGEEWTDPNGTVVLAQLTVHRGWVGQKLAALETAGGVRIAMLTRRGDGLVPDRTTVLQDGDLVHATLARSRRDAVIALFAAGPEGGH